MCTPCGDVTGVFALASVAAMQGRIAMYHFLGDAVAPLNLKTVSSNVFTDPEIATVGYTQADLDTGVIDAVGVKLPLLRNPRAKMQGIRDGFVKIFCSAGHRHRRGRCRGLPACLGADPPHFDRGRQQPDRRTDRERVHCVPVPVGFDRRGRAPAPHAQVRRRRLTIVRRLPSRKTPISLLAPHCEQLLLFGANC